jgi:CDP-glucose 4,6-dehydratase
MGGLVKKEFLSSFKGKRVFVTGDTGFKGSWLSFWLYELGAEVVGYALPPERDIDHFKLLNLDKMIHHIDADIRDFDKVKKTIDDFKPEFLFHFAAQPLVRLSYKEPKRTLDTNIGGSINLLEVARYSTSIRSVVYVTSDKCYKNKEWIWGYRENDELGGIDPYSASKACAEIVFSSYLKSFFEAENKIGLASVRAGNVIGGGDWALDRIVPDCIKLLQKKEPILIRNPWATRPWQHVLEPLYGYLYLSLKLYEQPKSFSGSWNFGPRGESIKTVKDLAEKIIHYWGEGEIQFDIQENAPHEAGLLHLNCDKSYQLLNWIPKWNFDKTINETVKWYKEVNSGSDAKLITRQQIQEYMEE